MSDYYLILNYKTYPESTGNEAAKLTEIVNSIQSDYPNVKVVVSAQATDISLLRQKFPEVEIWAQHFEAVEAGRNTGFITAEAITAAGANGSLINHSEHQISAEQIRFNIQKSATQNIQSCLLVPSAEFTAEVLNSDSESPDIIAYEPPELIGGDESPLVKPENVELSKQALAEFSKHNSVPLIGAGVKLPSDVTAAIELGFKGVLLASGFVKAEDPAKFLKQILSAFPA